MTARHRLRHVPLLVALGCLVGPLAAAPVQAQAEPADWPEAGDRVRIRSGLATGDFVVTQSLAEALTLREDSLTADLYVPTRSLLSLEVYEGQRSRFWGTVIGAVAGTGVGTMLSLPCWMQPHSRCETAPPPSRIIGGAVLGAAAGLIFIGGREIWREVRPSPAGPQFAAGPGVSAGEQNSGVSSRDVITSQEIRDLEARYRDVYELVDRERTNWLRPRSTTSLGLDGSNEPRTGPVVMVNGAQYGDAESLRAFSLTTTERLEYMSPADATTRFGTGFDGGAILLTTRR